MAEKISNFPKVIKMLENHDIGYHSSSHSIRPTIPEFTDKKNYEKAYFESIKRETSYINPLTGAVEGPGGIGFLRDLFSKKKIISFRAPGDCWTTPHLEALKELNIQFNFSANNSNTPVIFKKIYFYPQSFTQIWNGDISDYKVFIASILKNKFSVFDLHPWWIVNSKSWDFIYWKNNPEQLFKTEPRSSNKVRSLINRLELFFKILSLLKKRKFIEVTPKLVTNDTFMNVNEDLYEYFNYEKSISWVRKYFYYEPKYLKRHFNKYFLCSEY